MMVTRFNMSCILVMILRHWNLVDVVDDNYYNMQDLEEGTYYWNVNASDDLGGNTASTTWMFSIVSATNNAPLAFSVLAPSNGGQSESLFRQNFNGNLPLTLTWAIQYLIKWNLELMLAQYLISIFWSGYSFSTQIP